MNFTAEIVSTLIDTSWARICQLAAMLMQGLVAHRREYAEKLRLAEQLLRRYLVLMSFDLALPNARAASAKQTPPAAPSKNPTTRPPVFRLEEPLRTPARPKLPIPRIRDPFAPLPPPVIPPAPSRPDRLMRRLEALQRVLANPDHAIRAMARRLQKRRAHMRLNRLATRTRKPEALLETLDDLTHQLMDEVFPPATGPPA